MIRVFLYIEDTFIRDHECLTHQVEIIKFDKDISNIEPECIVCGERWDPGAVPCPKCGYVVSDTFEEMIEKYNKIDPLPSASSGESLVDHLGNAVEQQNESSK